MHIDERETHISTGWLLLNSTALRLFGRKKGESNQEAVTFTENSYNHHSDKTTGISVVT